VTAATCFVDAHAPDGPCALPCSHASTSTRANAAGAVATSRGVSGSLVSRLTGDLVPVKIITNAEKRTARTLADAEVILEAEQDRSAAPSRSAWAICERPSGETGRSPLGSSR
jgi:hypothetical protein